ncbi:MAG: aminopeptidase P family protein [Paracoccaceae bacterium]|nr:aminopeptidase P family protein [Paracoccaceae bacterium]
MFQTFDETTRPETGPNRLATLRAELDREGLDGFIVPRADAHQGEYVAPRDDRLAWLTGFTGSAGYCVALRDRAGVFADGRYRVQVRAQVGDVFSPVDWPEVGLADWIAEALPEGGTVGFDPWLHPVEQLRALQAKLPDVALQRVDNLVDRVWEDQPDPPLGAVFAQPENLAGAPHGEKIAQLAEGMEADVAVLTLPDSLAWLLNIRGSDIPRNPVPHGFAFLHAEGRVTLYMAAEKLANLGDHLGDIVTVQPPDAFVPALQALSGSVQIDPATCPVAVTDALSACDIIEAMDPCVLPKARKNAAELAGARDAHLRDGAAMVHFLAWLDAQDPDTLTEIDVVTALEAERRGTNALRDISFDTIAGAGPNGAIVHYRVNETTNRKLAKGELLLVDSGGQYVDGTTDITRTIALGEVGTEEKDAFTRVLKGMIAMSRLHWPAGMAGRDLDAVARVSLWEAGLDYGHGTGHGVGSYLCVHEGPQRLARTGTVPLEPGMMLSNEPGFYREGAYGIRLENLIAVEEAPPLPGQTIKSLLRFKTLTFVPLDLRLILPELLTGPERAWLNAYHAEVEAKIGPLVKGAARDWLSQACRAI